VRSGRANTKLRDLGLQPHLLGDELIESTLRVVQRYQARVVERAIAPQTRWKPGELGEKLAPPVARAITA